MHPDSETEAAAVDSASQGPEETAEPDSAEEAAAVVDEESSEAAEPEVQAARDSSGSSR